MRYVVEHGLLFLLMRKEREFEKKKKELQLALLLPLKREQKFLPSIELSPPVTLNGTKWVWIMDGWINCLCYIDVKSKEM